MLTKKIVFISVQPDVPYFHWQVEVFIHNAMKNGINPNWIEIVFGYDHHPSQEGIDIASRYPYVRVFFYKQDKNEKKVNQLNFAVRYTKDATVSEEVTPGLFYVVLPFMLKFN